MLMFSAKLHAMTICPKPSKRRFFHLSYLSLVVAMGVACPSVANQGQVESAKPIPESQLLLPRSYQDHLPALQESARLALSTERCVRLLQGGLQLDRSRPEHPVFRILCRDAHQQSYAMLIDGLSFHLIDDTRPGGSISFADLQAELEAERQRQQILEAQQAEQLLREAEIRQNAEMHRLAQEAIAQEAARLTGLWDVCQRQLALKVRAMRELVWITREMPEAHMGDDKRLRFYVDFDAEDLYRKPLHYRAVCDILSDDDHLVTIRPRQLMEVDEGEQDVIQDGGSP